MVFGNEASNVDADFLFVLCSKLKKPLKLLEIGTAPNLNNEGLLILLKNWLIFSYSADSLSISIHRCAVDIEGLISYMRSGFSDFRPPGCMIVISFSPVPANVVRSCEAIILECSVADFQSQER